ncbi:hypothetical protein [Streptomyces sp. H27-D2]|uniref:hypothetical protein n=1 Tax=Streptomyces sp. H27-D2 TaxID=3046304 RepID=UPI002DB67B8E|nr:hypothetical protein [Streptomyces sp. H27-D2]MEC4016003.1 hypothetical protein [Streptomyces sp. H27-D2]
MPPTPAPGKTARADSANKAIRAFLALRNGRALWPEERAEYERLVAAYMTAVRSEIEAAA